MDEESTLNIEGALGGGLGKENPSPQEDIDEELTLGIERASEGNWEYIDFNNAANKMETIVRITKHPAWSMKATVYVDNQAAINLKAIQGIKPNAGHYLIHRTAEELDNKVQRVDMELIWIFGLKGVQGNSTLLISTPKELHHISFIFFLVVHCQ
ncbi:hypothetical protein BU17DRAFT_67080 [Hysterangium stoloniferum]|nr:hypothetical protein BU17DRAFT_67080 [Hysterangium stoloniferum]